jgi:hypothetical protein
VTAIQPERREPWDVLDPDTRHVRVLSQRCDTCIFWPDDRAAVSPSRALQVIDANVAAGALLTCHSTLPYGEHPEFGPAVCAGFWARHRLDVAAGRMAELLLGVVRVDPPGAKP